MIVKRVLFVTMLFLAYVTTRAQLLETFADGNFTANPMWQGDTSDWKVNAAGQLQSNDTIAGSSFYLSTPSTLATVTEWDFYVNLKFATSGNNYADVYLTASASDVTALTTSGYFVRFGGTADDVCLYRKDAGGAAGIKIIDGVDGAVSSATNNQAKIKVIRNAASQWVLLRDMTATGNNYFTEGSVIDTTYTSSAFFGIVVKQSSVAGFAKKHFFDNIEIKPYLPDTTPPVVQTATAINAVMLDVLFDEPVDNASSQVTANYVADNSIGFPVIALLDSNNSALVHLSFAGSFPAGVNCRLTVNNVKDITGNAVINGLATFIYVVPYTAQHYDVVIDEIMASPTPQVTLPANKWIELKNTSDTAINLKGWKISGGGVISGPMPNFILLPDSFAIICAGSATAAMAPFGAVIAVTSFPFFDNNGALLSLISSPGTIIHAVDYSASWYQDDLKKKGGWSLEMINTKNSCSGISNWKASTDPRGGSPGIKNADDAVNADQSAPKLLRASATDPSHINLFFDEPLSELNAATINNYSISDGIGVPAAVVAVPPLFQIVNITLGLPLLASKIYTVTVKGIVDCAGNAIGNKNTTRVALSSPADSLDIVINEILFNPHFQPGSDYVEIYNRSNKVIDLKQMYIANRATNGAISSITAISAGSYLLFPQDFVVLTSDIAFVKSAYVAQNPDAFIALDLPSYNNDKGDVIILNAQQTIIDEVAYNDKWHFKLLANTEGVALERIDYNGPSQSADNWHSAATSVGYGTPTYKNSQYRINDQLPGEIKITPEIVSPDNDGQDDFATISYEFPEAGYVANITIFDGSGRPVRYLQRNALCGTKGDFRWDGLGEKNQALATGVYIIYTEVFNIKGKTKKFKLPIVLARRN